MSMKVARERALKGAAWLDRVRPGWDEYVNLTDLALESEFNCVLGQVFHFEGIAHEDESGYGWAVERYEELDSSGAAYGFDNEITYDPNLDFEWVVTYAELDKAWTQLIKARREQRNAYETYAENIAYSEGYEDGYFDGQHSMLDAPRIETVKDITARFPIAG